MILKKTFYLVHI